MAASKVAIGGKSSNRKKALDILWNMKKDKEVVEESKRILLKHTLSDRNKLTENS